MSLQYICFTSHCGVFRLFSMNHCCSRYVPCFNIYLIRHTNHIAALIASQIVVIMNNVCNMNMNMYTNMFVQITAWTWIQTWKTNTFMYECVHRNVFVHEHNVHGQWTCALTCLQTCKLTCKRTSTWTCAMCMNIHMMMNLIK